MKKDYDIIIIGSGPSGLYFSIKMAESGFHVIVIEKDSLENLGKRYDIFHLPKELLTKFGSNTINNEEFGIVNSFQKSISRSALDRYPKINNKDILVIHRHIFLTKLVNLAKGKNIEFLFEASFESILYDEKGTICGVKIKKDENNYEFFSKLVVDASGIECEVRNKIKEDYDIERFNIEEKDKFYVVLNYVKFENPEKDKIDFPIGWPYYKAWIAPSYDKNGAIIGIGANFSYEYAEFCLKRFLKKINLPSFKIQYVEKSCTPYHRFLYSFVENNFLVLGDAACLTDPMSGEGVALGWFLADIAAKVINKNLKNQIELTKDNLWQINKIFYDELGSNNEALFALLPYIIDCTENENDYEFEKGIIFTDDNKNPTKSIFSKLFYGLVYKKLKIITVNKILKGLFFALKISNQYKRYPDNPKNFHKWVLKTDKLWSKAKTMADVSFSDYELFQKGVI